MRVDLQPAFVLHRRPYRETSLLLEAFTAEHGRVGLVAKGAGRGRGTQRGVLQAFTPLLVSWVGRSELCTLTAVETAARPTVLAGRTLVSGLYLNELLLRLLPRNDPHPGLYAAYGGAVSALAEAGREEPVLRSFEVHLLRELGYGPLLTREAGTGAAVREEVEYRYVRGSGPVSRHDADESGLPVSGATLLALAGAGELSMDLRREAKQLMRFLLQEHLGDRPLETRQLFARERARGAAESTGSPDRPVDAGDHA